MPKRRTLLRLAAVTALLALPGAASATSTTPDEGLGPDLVALKRASGIYPQPVRAGDLANRYLIGPIEAQPVFGRVASPALVRQPDGSLMMAIDRGGVLGFGTTRVVVPLADVALMGEHVALVGLTQQMLGDIATSTASQGQPVPPDTIIKMGIVGPFH